jgi:hypothetical protein
MPLFLFWVATLDEVRTVNSNLTFCLPNSELKTIMQLVREYLTALHESKIHLKGFQTYR